MVTGNAMDNPGLIASVGIIYFFVVLFLETRMSIKLPLNWYPT